MYVVKDPIIIRFLSQIETITGGFRDFYECSEKGKLTGVYRAILQLTVLHLSRFPSYLGKQRRPTF